MDVTPFATMINRKQCFFAAWRFFLFSQQSLRLALVPFTWPADARLPASNDPLCRGGHSTGFLGRPKWPPTAQRQAPRFNVRGPARTGDFNHRTRVDELSLRVSVCLCGFRSRPKSAAISAASLPSLSPRRTLPSATMASEA